jgi:hypothetical protein
MNPLEILLYAVAVVAGIIAAVIRWKIYPLKVSRRDRWRTSDWDYVKDRILDALAYFILVGGAIAFCVHAYFHADPSQQPHLHR